MQLFSISRILQPTRTSFILKATLVGAYLENLKVCVDFNEYESSIFHIVYKLFIKFIWSVDWLDMLVMGIMTAIHTVLFYVLKVLHPMLFVIHSLKEIGCIQEFDKLSKFQTFTI